CPQIVFICLKSTAIGQIRVHGANVTSHADMEQGHVSGHVTIPRLCMAVIVVMICPDEWTSWSDWSSCSLTCGPGLKHRHRTCNYTIGTLLGGGCIGNDQERIECNLKSCDSYVLFYARGPTHEDIAYGETIVYGTVTIDKGGGYNSSNGVLLPRVL
ncbi:CADN-like protein, partial [Mya arenaria]